ncbi:MAG: hypothetical protein GTO45_36395 [Candidatus Aminicenantes bacterium]|nr:hypothetical protein [Candidatus Aminicenantes bacterium]NIM84183.1 hypothetical protein [Candidatus Aminicenantes bacterium]NIN23630.1 hypothetical protein [Candidatus Aminicenantes bacterium]NIN47337.1 hypothetical protein [Candidatus Aminicenantes bacterium]NIN90266.1 hypothetical protein [Candidatus Aminicenantes bacterium]
MKTKKTANKGRSLAVFISILLFLFLTNSSLQAQCGTSWGLVNYIRGDYVIRSIASNDSIYVAVGDGGLLWTSGNGIDWTIMPRNTTNQFSVIYEAADSQFVVVGDREYIATSSNGINWVQRKFNLSKPALWGIASDGTTYVAVGDKGTVFTSTDGATWTQRNSGTTARLFDVVYGEERFVAVAINGFYSSSDSGVTWQNHGSATGLISVTYGNGTFVAGGKNGVIYTSDNGINWTKRSTGVINYFWDLAFIPSSSLFVGVGNRGTRSTCMIITSPNGISWTWRESYVPSELLGVGVSSDKVLAGGLSGAVTISMCDPYDPQLVVASPVGGEVWDQNTTQTIRWGSFGTVGNVKLEYSTDNGGSWADIISSTANDGTHSWLVPQTPSTQCRVRVSDAAAGNPSDTSNAVFQIRSSSAGGTLTVTAPNGGEHLAIGSKYTITWTSSGVTDTIRIRFSSDGGNNFSKIADNLANSGSWTWTVPNINSSNCLIRINAINTDGLPYDVSNSTFTIGEGGGAPSITLISPNGGETLVGNTTHTIRWACSKEYDSIDIEYNDGSSWHVIKNGTEDDGEFDWTVPNIATTKARMWIKGWADDGDAVDFTDNYYTIEKGVPMGTILVTSPNGGEGWLSGSTHPITWDSLGTVGDVTISYSADDGDTWTTIKASTANDGYYSWTLPTDLTSDQCRVKVTDELYPQISDRSDYVFSVGGPPEISLSKARFNFGYLIGGAVPDIPQTLFISNNSVTPLNWTATAEASWINLNPASGTGDGVVNISINPLGMGVGEYTGTITVSDPDALNSPQTVDVYLKIKYSSEDVQPFGQFATPDDGITGVSGSVPVTGWALDDIGVVSVKIYREVNGFLSYIGDAVFVEGARPDVEQAYPDYPYNSRAGWGYMMLSNFLPDGELVLKAIASDTTGNVITLGTKTIYLDHQNGVKPFGAIDAPAQGGEAFGSTYRNQGWVLTPQPNKIPEDGSTINVFIDGVFIGKANYNIYRADIAQLFPGYANSNGAMAYLDFDTTTYSNGVHTIQWSASDDAGNSDGIGSRYFTIQNTNSGERKSSGTSEIQETGFLKNKYRPWVRMQMPTGTVTSIHDIADIPVDCTPARFRKGYNENSRLLDIYPAEGDILDVEINEGERIELQLGDGGPGTQNNRFTGFMVVGDKLHFLPIGSTLKARDGIFFWQPAAGFFGEYQLVFIARDRQGRNLKKNVLIRILPKFSK